jgi:hypothetical protein
MGVTMTEQLERELFDLTEHQKQEDELFNLLVLTIENYGREHGAIPRLLLDRAMIRAAGADIRASVNPPSAHEILQEEANDHWDCMKAERERRVA